MVSSDIIFKYFPSLTPEQKEKINALQELYSDWNSKINVISRKDIEELYLKHVLHGMSPALFADFEFSKKVLDFGTGGGFPGIPLAILFPEIEFHLVDSIAKKIKVVREIASALNLQNVKAEAVRVEKIQGIYDKITCRAVTRLHEFYPWIAKNMRSDSEILALKGGDLSEEIKTFHDLNRGFKVTEHELSSKFQEDFFDTKKLLIIKRKKK